MARGFTNKFGLLTSFQLPIRVMDPFDPPPPSPNFVEVSAVCAFSKNATATTKCNKKRINLSPCLINVVEVSSRNVPFLDVE